VIAERRSIQAIHADLAASRNDVAAVVDVRAVQADDALHHDLVDAKDSWRTDRLHRSA
jgi:hypothetical protein